MDGTKKGPDVKDVPFWTSARFGLAIIGFFGFVNLYALRINLSVAMVCMVNHTWIAEQAVNETVVDMVNKTATEDVITCQTTSSNASTVKDGPFKWNKDIQGHILGSFFYGYLITQVPGGWLASRFGGKRVFGWFMFGTAVATLLIPVASRVHYAFLIALRIITGMGSGVVFPAMHSMFANWAPPLERSKLASISYAGTQIGNVITLPIAGLLCEYGFDGGWPSIFYIFGGLGIIWFIIWMLVVHDSPTQHPRISKVERDYITFHLTGQLDEDKSNLKVPWLKIMTSLPMWAIIASNVTSDWGAYTFLTNIPSYMNDVLKFNIKSNGLFSALPYIGLWAMITGSGIVADKIRERRWLNTAKTRKLFNTIGQAIPAVLLIGMGFMDCSQAYGALAMLTLGVATTGAVYSSYTVNHVDLAPQYAGILFGISNSIASVTGFLAPYVIGQITKEGQSRLEWQIVFIIGAAIYAFGAIFYLIFADGELQEWAKEPLDKNGKPGERDYMVTEVHADDEDVESTKV